MMVEKEPIRDLDATLPSILSLKQSSIGTVKSSRKERRKRKGDGYPSTISVNNIDNVKVPGIGGNIGVHRCRFVKWTPSAVNSTAWTSDSLKIAIGRANGVLQIYQSVMYKSTKISKWHLCAMMKDPEGAPIDSIIWTPTNRLFTAGSLSCQILEWDLIRRCPKSIIYAPGGSVWGLSMSKNGRFLAIASEDQQIRLFLFESDDEEPEYAHSSQVYAFPGYLPKVNNLKEKGQFGENDKLILRILCMTWSDDSTQLITGSSLGDIVVWELASQKRLQLRAIRTMNLGQNFTGMIWCITLLQKEQVIVAGDSRGQVSFWSMSTGVLMATHRVHDAEVLSIASTPDSKTVFAAGVDPTLHLFNRISFSDDLNSSNDKQKKSHSSWTWTTGAGMTPVTLHRLDIRAMGVSPNGNHLITAGLDPDVLIHHIKHDGSLGRFDILPYTDQLQRNLFSYFDSSFIITGNYLNDPKVSAEIWRIKEQKPSLEFRLLLDSNSLISCTAINENWIAIGYNNLNSVRLWNKDQLLKAWDISGTIQLASNFFLILIALASNKDGENFLWTVQISSSSTSNMMVISLIKLGKSPAIQREWKLKSHFTPEFIRSTSDSVLLGSSSAPGAHLLFLVNQVNSFDISERKQLKYDKENDDNNNSGGVHWLSNPTPHSYFVDALIVNEDKNSIVIGISNMSLLEAEQLGRKAPSPVSGSKEEIFLSGAIISIWKDMCLSNRILIPLAPPISTRNSSDVKGIALIYENDSLILYSDRVYSLSLRNILNAVPAINLPNTTNLSTDDMKSKNPGYKKSINPKLISTNNSFNYTATTFTCCKLEELLVMLPLILSTPRGSDVPSLNAIIGVIPLSTDLIVIERSLEDVYLSLPLAFKRASLFRCS